MIFLNIKPYMSNSIGTRVMRHVLALRTFEFINKRQKIGIKFGNNTRDFTGRYQNEISLKLSFLLFFNKVEMKRFSQVNAYGNSVRLAKTIDFPSSINFQNS